MPDFTLAPLPRSRVAEAYPLVRMAYPQMSLAAWKAEAEARLANGGILTLFNPGGTIQALAAWQDDPQGEALKVDTFVVFELSRRAPARQALCEGLQALAAERGKAAVQFPLGSLGLLQGAPADAA